MAGPRVLWFRSGLRFHDNPALLEATKTATADEQVQLIPIFIFDGESAGTKVCGYNRMRFLIESLGCLDNQLREKNVDARLLLFRGDPIKIFRQLWDTYKISSIHYEQECEPIWRARDEKVEQLADELGINIHEVIGHTLWNPKEVIKANGDVPPLTYQMFLHTVETLDPPPRPVADANWSRVRFLPAIDGHVAKAIGLLDTMPRPEDFDIYPDGHEKNAQVRWIGGEVQALKQLEQRLKVEGNAFRQCFYLPNQARPDLLGPPTSMSGTLCDTCEQFEPLLKGQLVANHLFTAHLKFGCLSVRRFYWSVHDLFNSVQCETAPNMRAPAGSHITGQLIWREYFYTMSVYNPKYGEMVGNPICLDIPWRKDGQAALALWKNGKTGFPLIDAAMRQLMSEGWLHHTLRNTVATFLTRGGLWICWEYGFKHFLKYLLDADWSVCAGNWMWVSSSAFEKLLDSSKCTCPLAMAKHLDPNGEYIRRYLPELRNLPTMFIHEPWRAPPAVQDSSKCVVGVDYPHRMIDFQRASAQNNQAMQAITQKLIGVDGTNGEVKSYQSHCRPSSDQEINNFFWLFDERDTLSY